MPPSEVCCPLRRPRALLLHTATSFSNNYYSVLYRGLAGWIGIRDVGGVRSLVLDPATAPAESDEFAMGVPVAGSNGKRFDIVLMLRADVELGLNTSSLWAPPTGGPTVPNSCIVFGDLMEPLSPFPGEGPANMTAQQNASCPRRAANLAVIADFVASTAL